MLSRLIVPSCIVLLVFVVTCPQLESAECRTQQSGSWSDSETWSNNRAPQSGDTILIQPDHAIVFDQSNQAAFGAVRIEGSLRFDPKKSLELSMEGNLLLLGKLTLAPASPNVRHVITFTNIDEAKYVGDGMRMLESDVGLWVMRDGLLEAVGAKKTP